MRSRGHRRAAGAQDRRRRRARADPESAPDRQGRGRADADRALRAALAERALQRATGEVGAAERYGITSPRDGSIFAIDPDIPPAAQRITFEGERGAWRLDGRPLGVGERLRWAPWPGRHRLDLVAASGETLQSVAFEVRGAGVKGRGAAPR